MCYECGCYNEEHAFLVYDLYNYKARPQRSYHRLDHFKEVLGQFQGRGGKQIPAEILHQLKLELPIFSEVTVEELKKTMRKPKLTKHLGNL